MAKPNDRVERETFMRASIERAFAALTDPALFPTWGPERVVGTMAVGQRPIFDFGPGGKCAVYIVAIDAPRYFAYRWIQGVHDPEIVLGDPLAGPNTLVEFHLDERDGGTRVESGIDKLPSLESSEPANAGERGSTETNIDEALENMGKGWQLMLGGLPRHFSFTGGDRTETELVVPAAPSRVHETLMQPAQWWFGAPPIEVTSTSADIVTYRWKRDDGTTDVTFQLDDAPAGTRIRHSATGFASEAEAKRAHQLWGVILGMLEMALAPNALTPA